MARRLVCSFIAAALFPAVAAGQPETTVKVMLNHAHVMRLPEKTATVIIGNPIVADIVVQKNGVVVVTGKSFGTTNLIVLDSAGAIVSESLVNVTASKTEDVLLVQRGMTRETYSCNPACQPSVQLGDADEYYGKSGDQVTKHRGLSTGQLAK